MFDLNDFYLANKVCFEFIYKLSFGTIPTIKMWDYYVV